MQALARPDMHGDYTIHDRMTTAFCPARQPPLTVLGHYRSYSGRKRPNRDGEMIL